MAVAASRRYLSKGAAVGVGRILENRRIRRAEDFGAELEIHAFMGRERKVLHDGDVGRLLSWADDRVAPQIAESAGRRNTEDGGIEPLGQFLSVRAGAGKERVGRDGDCSRSNCQARAGRRP